MCRLAAKLISIAFHSRAPMPCDVGRTRTSTNSRPGSARRAAQEPHAAPIEYTTEGKLTGNGADRHPGDPRFIDGAIFIRLEGQRRWTIAALGLIGCGTDAMCPEETLRGYPNSQIEGLIRLSCGGGLSERPQFLAAEREGQSTTRPALDPDVAAHHLTEVG